ncbi:MAG: histidinol dehydrogenase [Chitinophagaceae bacterium]
MEIIMFPEKGKWKEFLQRPKLDSSLERRVAEILADIRLNGDEAVRRYSLEFDQVIPDDFLVSPQETQQAIKEIDPELQAAICQARDNITKFHSGQLIDSGVIETMPGVKCWRRNIPIDKVGLYIPGGTAPLFSTLLMLGIPARMAGCEEITLCTPPDKTGKVHPAILFTADLVGISRIYKIGGVQAIGAMAFGTDTVAPVYKIFGPGNTFVMHAKELALMSGVSIDLPAGPSEVLILADQSCIPSFVAADLLSQAEHGPESQVLLVTLDEKIAAAITGELDRQLEQLPRREVATLALKNSRTIVLRNLEEALDLINEYAPEHLILCCDQPEQVAEKIRNAGSVFLGNYSPESAGDYASGTNHTLPTNGYAKVYSGVSLDSFVKKITYQQITEQGLGQIGRTIELMAGAEGLEGHRQSVSIRLAHLKKPQNPPRSQPEVAPRRKDKA